MVNYTKILLDCIKNIEQEGYTLIDVPYYVKKEISNHTKPEFIEDLYHNENMVYVGSGEQSFLHLINENNLSYGTYSCLTPCFRNEIVLDDQHLKMFLKLELIDYIKPELNQFKNAFYSLDRMINIMIEFYSSVFDKSVKINVVEVVKDIQFDININNIEVGSYGIRETLGGDLYVYGTGIALPRLQVAIESIKGEL